MSTSQEKLEQRAWKFVSEDNSRIPITSLSTAVEFARAELQKAAEIAERSTAFSHDRIWMANLVQAIRKLME